MRWIEEWKREEAQNYYKDTSAAVMLGNDVLNSLIVYSRTKIALLG